MLAALFVYCGVGVVWLTAALDYGPGEATYAAILWPAWVLRAFAKVASVLGD